MALEVAWRRLEKAASEAGENVDAVDAWMKDGTMHSNEDTGFILAVSEQVDGAEASTMDAAPLAACFGPLSGEEVCSTGESVALEMSCGFLLAYEGLYKVFSYLAPL